MPVYEYTYTVVMRGTIQAQNITDAAAQAHSQIQRIREAKLLSVTRIDPPLPPTEQKDAA